jgi:DNA polymerase I
MQGCVDPFIFGGTLMNVMSAGLEKALGEFNRGIVIPRSVADAKLVMRRFHKRAKEYKAYALDTETTGLSWQNDRMVMISLYTPGMAVVLPLAWASHNIHAGNAAEILKNVAEDDSLRVYMHNAKFDMHFLYNNGVWLDNEVHDTLVAGFDLSVEKPVKLKLRAREELGIEMTEFKDKFKLGGKSKLTLMDYPVKDVAEYAALDVFSTYWLADKYFEETGTAKYHHSVYLRNEDTDLSLLYDRVDAKVVPVLWNMERAGVRIDVPKLEKHKIAYEQSLVDLEKRMLAEAGVAFNMRSPKQVTQVFSRRGLALKSTDEKHMSAVAKRGDALAKLMMEHRKSTKILSTYIIPMLENRDAKDRVHTSFNIHVAATGRLSSSAPLNMQNQPRDKWWREMFIAAPGHKLVVRDYSQIELRVLAILADDEVMLEEYRNGADVHMNNGHMIASTLNVPWDTLDDSEKQSYRTWSKSTLGFGVVFGMGPKSLAAQLGVDEETAEMLICTIFNKYRGIDRWIKGMKQQGLRTGRSKTMFGRIRDIPNLFSKDNGKLQYGLRQLINGPVQGGAGDFMKLGMLEVAKNKDLQAMRARLLLTIHDELMLEVKEEYAEEANLIMDQCMSRFPAARKMPIPFPTEGGVGDNWWAAKKGK